MRTLTSYALLAFTLLAIPAAAAPPKPAPRPAAKAVKRPAASKPGQRPKAKASLRQQRLARAQALLTQASKASKSAAVRKSIAATLALLKQKQFRPAYVKVSELKRTAAVTGDTPAAVMKLVEAEEVIGHVAARAQAKKK